MKRILTLTLLLALPAVSQQPQPAPAADKPAAASGGEWFFGTRGVNNDGWAGRVNEYEANKSGLRPTSGFNYWVQRDKFFLDLSGENRGDSRAQSYSLDLDWNRRIRVRSTLDRFLHRLDNDPLTNLDVAKGSVVVRHDDLSPNRAFVPGRNEMNTRVSGTINSWLSWRASHRFLQLHGETQTRALSKCANCHATAESTRINQKMHDVSAGLTVKMGSRAAVHYDFTSRQFKEDGERPTNQYDVAQHPTSLSRVFFNRVIYDGTTNGQMAYAYVPGFRKDTHDLKLTADLPGESKLTANLLKTKAHNTHVNLNLKVTAWGAGYAVPLGRKALFKAQVRSADMESDEVFIQLEEPVNPAGVPQAGQSYVQAYPDFGSVDWTRRSSIDRRDTVASGELSYRPVRLTTLRGGYQFRSIRRDNFEVERTDRNRLYFLFNTRKSQLWKARLRYTYDDIDQPFLHHKAALPPALQLTPSPGNPPSPLFGVQYFTMYAARQADLTNQPNRSQFVEPSFTWTPSARVALTAHYRTRLEKNDKLNFGTWSHDTYMPGAELWVAPMDRLNFTLSYQQQYDKSNTLFVIPAFDG